MLNTTSLEAVKAAQFSQRFVRPLYDTYCFANIPKTTTYLLTGDGEIALPPDVFGNLPRRYDKVILFFVDAFGWRFFERYADKYPFLRTILRNGMVSKLTSQFPSTTAAHTTCINTGLSAGQSGIYEWHYYEPLVDDIITPLMFSYARDKERDTLKRSFVPAAQFYPRQTVYQSLKDKGVVSYIFLHSNYAHSTFSEAICRGGIVVPFKSLATALESLTEMVLKQKAPPYYYYLYFDRIDAMGHAHGPNSPQFEQEVAAFLTVMEKLFYQILHGKAGNTLFLMTADHGMSEVNPQTTFYLNKEARAIEQYLKTNRQGKLLVPAGSARDMFLYVYEERIDEAVAYLQQVLQGRAEVYKVANLIAQHFFSAITQQLSQTFLDRVGNVVILPYRGESVWWYEEGVFEMRFRGHHGGLTPEEMEIPLLALPLV
jgi:predicted AlkP superfamily pyrophosphatase or phosphodiesterase